MDDTDPAVRSRDDARSGTGTPLWSGGPQSSLQAALAWGAVVWIAAAVLIVALHGSLLDEAVLEAGQIGREIHVSCGANGLLATGEPLLPRHAELIYGLGNLIENAAEFARSAVWVAATYSAQQVTLEIADDGPGFASDIISHLGEPYTSSRRAEEGAADGEFGLGLGFFIARTLIRRSGGLMEPRNLKADEVIETATPGGACVRISWPRKQLEQRIA